jgi:membrane protease YdiL (CAAX protease family)
MPIIKPTVGLLLKQYTTRFPLCQGGYDIYPGRSGRSTSFVGAFSIFLRFSLIFFVLINPCLEEGCWRGLLLDAASGWTKWLAILYSSVLFMLNHLWMAVLVTGARNPAASAYQFMFGVLMSLVYLKTQRLRWPVAAHFLVNLLTPTVAVFLNLYVPGAPG